MTIKKTTNKKSGNSDVVLLAEWLILLAAKRKCSVTNSKLQVLLYYSQVWHLVFYQRELFKEPLEAWMHGPAIFKVYKYFEDRSFLSLPYRTDLPEIPAKMIRHLSEILEVYLPFPTETLERMVRHEFPWQNARRGLREQESSRNPIAIEDILSFYTSKMRK